MRAEKTNAKTLYKFVEDCQKADIGQVIEIPINHYKNTVFLILFLAITIFEYLSIFPLSTIFI